MSERITRVGTEINPARVEQPVLAAVHDYWNRKRRARKMPSRADIVPSELREHLGWIVMVDVQPGFEDFRYRLIGTLVSQYFLVDATGKTIREAFVEYPEAVTRAVLAVHRKCARDQAVVLSHGGADWMGRGFEEFESLYLPLSDDGKTCNVMLTAFVFDRAKVMLAREIARANGGRLPELPPKPAA